MNNEFEEKGYKLVDLNFGFEDLMVKSFEECVRVYNFQPKQDTVVSCKSIDIYMEFLASIVHKDDKGDHLSAYDEPDNEFMHGHVRKLSMTVLLNSNYEGGEFQFATYGKEKCEIDTPEFNKTGMIIVFPSDMEHRVAPVTKGIRYSLVTWFLGPPFK